MSDDVRGDSGDAVSGDVHGPGGGRLQVSVITPSEVAFSGAADSVVAPAHDGKFGILRGHAPMTVLLGEGDVTVRVGGKVTVVRVSDGFLQVLDDEVSVLAEEVETG